MKKIKFNEVGAYEIFYYDDNQCVKLPEAISDILNHGNALDLHEKKIFMLEWHADVFIEA